MYSQIGQVIEAIKNAENIILAGHVSPDGDAVSASFALALAIEKLGKKPTILLQKYSSAYDYLKGHHLIYQDDLEQLYPDLFIALDCGDIKRLGEVTKVFEKAKKTINIDHHMSNDDFADLNVVNKQGSSTSEVVYEIISQMLDLDLDMATAIYTGIVFDTMGFKHNSTKKRTHQIAGELISKGVDSAMVHTNVIYTHTLGNARLLAKAIFNLEIDNKIAISILTKDEILKECKAQYSEMEGISGYLLDIEDVLVSVFLYEKLDGTTKVSFRAKELDVNEIAGLFNGGGHKLASGATLNTPIVEAKKTILQEIKARL